MWRTGHNKPAPFARPLDEVLSDFAHDPFLREWTDQIINEAKAKYPALREALNAPQSANHHGEGPMIEDHVREILKTLYALVEGRFRLSEIEEFARLGGYEGELEELEETIKERAAFFKAFALLHDIGKGAAISFTAEEGSLGAEQGFGQSIALGWGEYGGEERYAAQRKYEDLFDRFAAEHPDLTSQEIQAEFFRKYKITIHHHGHARLIHLPMYEEVARALAEEYRLTEDDTDLLIELCASHMDPLHKFWHDAQAKDYDLMVKHAVEVGRDPDDFLDLLLAGTFLDVPGGSLQLVNGGYHRPSAALINFMKAEHDYMPHRRAQTEQARAERMLKQKREVYRQVGLDGDTLLDFMGMTPGPDFGKLLKEIQGAVERPEMMPDLSPALRPEVSKRIVAAREKIREIM